MDFVTGELLSRIGILAVLSTVALAVITEKLVPASRLRKAEERADRWERVALDALTLGARAGVAAAETTAAVASALPDPAKKGNEP